jgi:Core-2/I-Branching enzyme
MKVACLIITYTSAQQTYRLVKKLNNGDFDFYIHVDKKLDLETHRILFDIPNVYFIKNRVDIIWGSFTSVIATTNGLKQIEESGIKYDYVSLMSGQDYPIKSPEYITDFLEQNNGKQFIYYKDFKDWPGAQKRLDTYFLTDLKFRGKFRIQILLNSLIKKRKAPENITFYGFSTFWTLTIDCALHIVHYLENNPKLVRFIKYTFGSDEYIYPTVIMNSDYRNAVVNNNYQYVDWSAGGDRPKFLKAEDFENIIASDCIYGRKFNIDLDADIFDMIDDYNLKDEHSYTKQIIG